MWTLFIFIFENVQAVAMGMIVEQYISSKSYDPVFQHKNLTKLKWLCYAIVYIDWISFCLGVPTYLFPDNPSIRSLTHIGFIISHGHTIVIAFIFNQVPKVLLSHKNSDKKNVLSDEQSNAATNSATRVK